jgi:transposase
MERYLGLDVHAASSTLVVVSAAGRRLQRMVLETNGQALVEAIRAVPGRKHLCFEEGTQSAWLYEILSPHVSETVVAGVVGNQGPKSDARDAEGLAEKLRTGTLDRRIFKAPREFTLLRDLARSHSMLVQDVVRVQSRLKSVYRSRGIRTPGPSVYSKSGREKWKEQLSASARGRAERLYEQLDFLVNLKDQAESDLVRESRRHDVARLLQTIPGLGAIRVARLLPIVVTPHRFRTRAQFWSYCGLAVVRRSSSDWVQTSGGQWTRAQVHQTRGLNRHHNGVLKDIFKGAATTVITNCRTSELYEGYQQRLADGTRPPLAKLTLARKIASVALAVWKKGDPYKS